MILCTNCHLDTPCTNVAHLRGHGARVDWFDPDGRPYIECDLCKKRYWPENVFVVGSLHPRPGDPVAPHWPTTHEMDDDYARRLYREDRARRREEARTELLELRDELATPPPVPEPPTEPEVGGPEAEPEKDLIWYQAELSACRVEIARLRALVPPQL